MTIKKYGLKYENQLDLAYQLVSTIYIIIQNNIKKEEKYISFLVKYNIYTTEANITCFIK